MISSNRLHSWSLATALLSGQALAVGFGDIALTSRVGEPLHAEVGIVAGPRDTVETACFSLAPLRESDLPVITAARIKLVRDGQGYRLIISGTAPLADPVFVLALRAGCGIELQRDFVLMPASPIMTAEAAPVTLVAPQPLLAAAEGAGTKPMPGRNWQANQGDTLESIAENLAPDDLVRQRRLLAALKRANPELAAAPSLAEGTTVYVPSLRKAGAETRPTREQAAPRPAALPPPERAEALPPPKPKPKPRVPIASTKPAAGGNDRLTLGAPPADFKPGEKPQAPQVQASGNTPPEMEERLQRMEKTVTLLNEEIAKLNQALALTSEVLSAQQKLQAAQAAQGAGQPPQGAVREASLALPAPLPAAAANGSNWIELVLSALGGGIIAAIAAHILVLRRKNAVDSELPLAVLASRAPSHPESLFPAGAAALGAETIDSNPPARGTDPAMAGNQEDKDKSAVELAEIMVSFGRLQEATDTLAEYVQKEGPGQVQPWLMLLDLYRRGDRPREFGILARRIRDKFNVHVPAWSDIGEAESDGPDALERYPHIVEYLTRTWGQQNCLDYLRSLLQDNRSGERQGFSRDVVEEIDLLVGVLENGYGLRPA